MAESKPIKMDLMGADQHCSFCAKSRHEVKALVAGPGVFICNECTEAANGYIEKHQSLSEKEAAVLADTAQDQMMAYLASKPPEELLEGLVNVERTRICIDNHQQSLVDLLRSKRIPWVEIGSVLGVTRQAAWQRFGAAG